MPGLVRGWLNALLPRTSNDDVQHASLDSHSELFALKSSHLHARPLPPHLARTHLDDDDEASAFFVDERVPHKAVNFVLPLSGRWETFERFMLNYEQACLAPRDNTQLVVVLFENEHNNYQLVGSSSGGDARRQSELVRARFHALKSKYGLAQASLRLLVSNLNFSRSIGCEMGAAEFGTSELIFFVDVDIVFTREFLLRARLNTVEFKQVYYPIVYSEYDPDEPLNAIKVREQYFLFFEQYF